mgnify:CR=1 FL=1
MTQFGNETWFGSNKTLYVTMSALRKRLSESVLSSAVPVSLGAPNITTLRGHGYRLEIPSTP